MAKRDDDRLLLRISNKLTNVGIRSPCRVNVDVYNGDVTLKGLVQYQYQRRAVLTAVRTIDGVRSIVDQLKVEPPHRWEEDAVPPPPQASAPPIEAE